jgi:hypothetical protein
MKNCKGFTTLELMIATGVGILVVGGAASVMRMGNVISSKTFTDNQAKEMLSRAIARMAPTIREAKGVDTEESDDSTLDVVLPQRDTTGEFVRPLQDGDDTMFYLSDPTGDPDVVGTILWRAVNGTPDKEWSMRKDKGAIDLHMDGLRFKYSPDEDDPDTIQISVSALIDGHTVSVTRNLKSKIAMRNHASGSDDTSDDNNDDSNTTN